MNKTEFKISPNLKNIICVNWWSWSKCKITFKTFHCCLVKQFFNLIKMSSFKFQNLYIYGIFFSNFIVCIFVQAPRLGMPLFCYKDKILNVGIELKMKGNDVKTFYNIGSEKNWILSVMEDNEIKGKINDCLLTKH